MLIISENKSNKIKDILIVYFSIQIKIKTINIMKNKISHLLYYYFATDLKNSI